MRRYRLTALTVLLAIPLRAAPLFVKSPFGPVAADAGAPSRWRGDPSDGNRVAILNSGYDALLLRVHLIRNASRSINIQTFIWTNDECGRLMMYELIEAARRGVKVRVIADHMVSDKDPDTVAFLATVHPNLEIKHYRPAARRIRPSRFHTVISGLFSMRDINQRMHNKLMTFDDVILITGGRNIENTYFDHATELNFKDRDVLAAGPVVGDALRSFEQFWDYRHSVASRELVDVQASIRQGRFRRYGDRSDYAFGSFFVDLDRQADSSPEIEARFVKRLRAAARVSFLADKPGKNDSLLFWGQGRITRQLSQTIGRAGRSVLMQSPYVVLSAKAADLFRGIKQRTPGLRIAISSNSFGATDNLLAYSANYRLRGGYIEDLGLEIHEYKPLPADLLTVFPLYPQMKALALERRREGKQDRLPFLCIHAKSLVVDGRTAYIGSFNLDPRSENLNTEVGLLIEDEAIAAELSAEMLADMSARNSWVIAKRAVPLHLDKVNRLVDGILGLSPIDLWPIQNTTSFELIPGSEEVAPAHPDFYGNYREAGDFPGAEGALSTREILTRLYKALGPAITPML